MKQTQLPGMLFLAYNQRLTLGRIQNGRKFFEDMSLNNYSLNGEELTTEYFAAAFDRACMNMHYHHPILVTKAKLFVLESGNLREIRSARLFFEDALGQRKYFDIVHFDTVSEYIINMCSHFEIHCTKSLRKIWNSMISSDWIRESFKADLLSLVKEFRFEMR